MDALIKDISYFLVAEMMLGDKEISSLKIKTPKKNITDLDAIKKYYDAFNQIEIIEDQLVNTNSFNRKDIYDYYKNKKLKYIKNRINSAPEIILPIKLPPKYIYIEDFNDINRLEYLEKYAKANNLIFVTQKSFARGSKSLRICKMDLDIVQRINILRKAVAYIGYDYSVLANTALKHFKKEKAYILDSGTLSEMELFCKFAPTRDLDFIIKNLDLECL